MSRHRRKMERKRERHKFRLDKKAMKLKSREENTYQRNQTRQHAYQNGIDPRGYIASSVKSVADAAASIYSPASSFGGNGDPNDPNNPNNQEVKDNSILMWILGLLGLSLMFKK